MNFHFANIIEQNNKKYGAIKEGNIDETGKITYTKNESFGDHKSIQNEDKESSSFSGSFEEQIASELMKRLFGVELSQEQLTNEAYDKARTLHGIKKEEPVKNEQKCPTKKPAEEPKKDIPRNEPVKIGVDVTKLNDDEFIEFTKRRANMNKQYERFKAIKSKLRKVLEGNTYNDKMFNMFIKLHDIDKRGFFNRTQEDNAIVDEAVMLYGSL